MRSFNKKWVLKCHSEGQSPEESQKAWENKVILSLRFTQGQNDRGRNGFTLLELMISIALIGIIAAIVAGSMRLGFRSVDSGEKKIESLERVRASLSVIDSQVQSEIPLTYDENGAKKFYFKGSRESMRFATNYSIWGGDKGYVVVKYRVESAPDRRQTLYASEKTIGIEKDRETKLFDNLDAIYFEYFYKGPTDSEGRWVEQWTDDNNFPEKIRLHINDGARYISIIIPMRARGALTAVLRG